MANFVTGIDDIGTMNAKCSGWTVISIDYSLVGKFEEEARKILQSAKLKSFHGKEFKRKKADSYTAFLKLVRSTLESGNGFVSCTLLGKDWKSDFESFCNNVIGGSFTRAGVTAGEITEASKNIAAPLFTYQRLASVKLRGGSTQIQIDRHVLIDQLKSSKVGVSGTEFSGQLPIVAALRAYGRDRFPRAPEIEREGILICPDEESILVQAADIIGNFSTAFAFKKLGKKSKSNDLKCSVFEEAFGDLINLDDFPGSVKLNGDDLELEEGRASFTFSIGGADA
ncbi:hypothetical protein ACJJI3_11740 [Microbulbifer sp. ZKSA004]|uniref:hypothetical protein n=1 Tax=Microbulbifer sp. ZKSA004 TaxID=3243389 RepID=UPI00403A3FD9